MNSRAEIYRQLIAQYLGGEIPTAQFEATFLDCFKREAPGMPEKLFKELDRLFGDVDMFCANEELRGDGDLDEEGLRQACIRTLAAIAELQYRGGDVNVHE